MREIYTNILVTQNIASEMSKVSNQALTQSISINKAKNTTVAGNSNARSTIDTGSQLMIYLATAWNRDMDNIRSVVETFQRQDQQLKTLFSNPLDGDEKK